MEQLKHFAGKGLYRLIQEELPTYSDAKKVADEIASGTYGQSLVWKINYKTDKDENAIEGTYKVYQKIMHEPKVLDTYAEAVKSPTQYAAECAEYARDRKLSDKISTLNDKVNGITAIATILLGAIAWGWLYYVRGHTGIECAFVMAVVGFVVMGILWWHCTVSCDQ